jgi:hypothetical protein
MFQESAVNKSISFWLTNIGDPRISSWLVTLFCGVALVAAVYKWKDLKHTNNIIREQNLWLLLIFTLLVLGINKQLKFDMLFFYIGRHMAEYQGWYAKHRLVKAWFAYTLSGILICGGLFLLISMRTLWRSNTLALIGLGIVLIYTIIRTTWICHVGFIPDSYNEGNFRLTDMIELLGVLCIFGNALIGYKKHESADIDNGRFNT